METGTSMQLKGKMKINYSFYRRVLYALCFFMFCLIDQRTKTCSPLDGGREFFCNLTGVVMAVIIGSHYRIEEFKQRKTPYLIWGAGGIVISVVFYLIGKSLIYFPAARAVAALDIYLFGFILIHTYISVFMENKRPKLNKKFMVLWLLMLALMIASRSRYVWPFTYLIMFGCFYLTDYTKEEQEDLLQGMLDGIILSFFAFQAWCCAFRPYDYWDRRYWGGYSNANHNALYYVTVLVAAFCKLIDAYEHHKKIWLKIWYWVIIGSVYTLLIMTIGRSAWIIGFILGIVGLWSIKYVTGKKNFIRNGFSLVLCVGMLFLPVFGLVRYMPPVFHHPVWFFGEWGTSKVHSWDEWNSDKYVDLDELLETLGGRMITSVRDLPKSLSDAKETELDEQGTNAVREDSRYKNAIFKTFPDSYTIRTTIYEYYFKHLNLGGQLYEEQGFQLTPTYWIGHAHNIYLQYGTDFGIPVMLLFAVILIGAEIRLMQYFRETTQVQYICDFMLLLIPTVFGIFEYCWGTGSLSITLLFISLGEVICEREKVNVCGFEENN